MAADPQLERLQVEAGSRIGGSLALPQLAAVARVAQRLRIPVSRRVLAAGNDQDVDMWVRAVPEGEEVALTIEQWQARVPSTPRLAVNGSAGPARLESAPLTWSVDEKLRLVSVAPELADETSAAVGEPLTKIFRLEENGEGDMPLLSALTSRSRFSDQTVTARNGGQQFVLSGEAIIGGDGEFAGFEGLARPSHQPEALPIIDGAIQTALRSPLDAIVRTAEEMTEWSADSVTEEYSAYAADIAAAARHLLSVIRSLGERSEAAGAQQVDLAELVEEAVGLVEAAANERSIAIAVEKSGAVFARAESRGVIQILVNLLGNAIRYSPKGSAIAIAFERMNGSALVHVSDEGPGIAPADEERIFQPFQQGRSGGEGSGLGLAIARRLARAMHGEIRLQTVAGEGSRFTLILPAA